jgi:acetyltransferase
MESTPRLTFDPVHDVLRYDRKPLDAIFSPKTVAVIGATEKEGSVGRTILWNLISNPFGGTVFPVNPNRTNVLGIKAYPDLASVPEPVDLAVIVTPAATVPAVIAQCVDAGAEGAIIISAGFKEIGADGAQLESRILAEARRGRMRIIGPNCLGVMNTLTGLNATFASRMARPGSVAFLSQSGALGTAILDWSHEEHVGFSAFVSIGSMLDVGWGDLIDYLGDDPKTQSIVIYMESIGDARSFLSAAREVSLNKPIIVIKPGRTEGAARAAASHTGSLTGSDEVLEAAFRRSGVIRVSRISDLFHTADVLSKQPRPKGPRLTILTNAGGPAVLATDALVAAGGELTELSPATSEALDQLLPPHWSRGNPIDILGDASPERYAKSLEIAAQDPASDGLLVILTPQAMTDPTKTAEVLKPYAQSTGKPILASWMGGEDIEVGASVLTQAGIPAFSYPDTAAEIFTYMWRYAYNLRSIYETPTLSVGAEELPPDRDAAERMVQEARASGRTVLTEIESKNLLAAYGIPVVPTRVARTPEEAARLAAEIGYPVVLKLLSESITHKSDVGGVQLNLNDEEEVRRAFRAIQTGVAAYRARAGGREATDSPDFLGVTVQLMIPPSGYELILGSSIDAQFGPVVLFGSGGQLVEVVRDRSLSLPPLTTTLARRMMEQTRIFSALKGVRGRAPVDIGLLEHLIVRFSQLVVEQRWIKEIDINPLLVSAERVVALDARVLLFEPDVTEEQLPRTAVRPYPGHFARPWTLSDGTQILIRPIRPEDEPLMVRFHQTLSDRSVYLRYFHPLMLTQRVAHERLARICHIDYDREIALVAEVRDPSSGEPEIIGAARIDKLAGYDEARISMLISDAYQARGLGSELLKRLVEIGKAEKLTRLTAVTSGENVPMKVMLMNLGFSLASPDDKGMVTAEMKLQRPDPAPGQR